MIEIRAFFYAKSYCFRKLYSGRNIRLWICCCCVAYYSYHPRKSAHSIAYSAKLVNLSKLNDKIHIPMIKINPVKDTTFKLLFYFRFMRIMLCDCKRKEINPLPHELTQHPQTTPDIVPFTILQDSIQKVRVDILSIEVLSFHLQTCYAVRFAIFRMRKEGQIRLQWILLFDRLDFYLLLLFQALNILVSALFMR